MAGPVSVATCAGPSQWFTRIGTGGTWYHLGMCEGDTTLQLTTEYEDINIDGGGSRMAFDRQFISATGQVSGDLIFYKNNVLRMLRNYLGDATASPGQWAPGTIGTLVKAEGKQLGLAIVSQYAAKSAYAGVSEPAFVFPWVTLMTNVENLSTRTRRVRLSFDCLPVMDGLGGGTLYTNTISGISLPDVS